MAAIERFLGGKMANLSLRHARKQGQTRSKCPSRHSLRMWSPKPLCHEVRNASRHHTNSRRTDPCGMPESRRPGQPFAYQLRSIARRMPHRHDEHGPAADCDADESAADDLATKPAQAPLVAGEKNERPARPRLAGLHVSALRGPTRRPLNDAATRDEADQHHDDRNDEQKMDQPTPDVQHAEAENPQDEENDRKCPKHCRSPRYRVSCTRLL